MADLQKKGRLQNTEVTMWEYEYESKGRGKEKNKETTKKLSIDKRTKMDKERDLKNVGCTKVHWVPREYCKP